MNNDEVNPIINMLFDMFVYIHSDLVKNDEGRTSIFDLAEK